MRFQRYLSILIFMLVLFNVNKGELHAEPFKLVFNVYDGGQIKINMPGISKGLNTLCIVSGTVMPCDKINQQQSIF